MTTPSDAKVVNRESTSKSLLDRYSSKQKAGGSFSAYDATTNTMIQGVQSPHGYTQQSVTWTVNSGFYTKIPYATPNFNDSALNYSDKIIKKISKQKYTDGKFGR